MTCLLYRLKIYKIVFKNRYFSDQSIDTTVDILILFFCNFSVVLRIHNYIIYFILLKINLKSISTVTENITVSLVGYYRKHRYLTNISKIPPAPHSK